MTGLMRDGSIDLSDFIGKLKALLGALPITYSVGGKQFVAIASATAIFSFGLHEPVQSVPLPRINVE